MDGGNFLRGGMIFSQERLDPNLVHFQGREARRCSIYLESLAHNRWRAALSFSKLSSILPTAKQVGRLCGIGHTPNTEQSYSFDLEEMSMAQSARSAALD